MTEYRAAASATGAEATTAGRRVTASTTAARVDQAQARRALERVTGVTADQALVILRFSPADACEPVHRLVAKAVADLRRSSPGVSEADLVVSGGWVADGEAITRVRRHAHGKADWITTYTTAIGVELTRQPGRDDLIAALRDGVIDPDLGVNVVDLGFVRDAAIRDGTASVVMTLTSPACPLTKVIEDQARTAVVGPLARELRIEWTWSPCWSPADITAEGREQLTAVGFTFR